MPFAKLRKLMGAGRTDPPGDFDGARTATVDESPPDPANAAINNAHSNIKDLAVTPPGDPPGPLSAVNLNSSRSNRLGSPAAGADDDGDGAARAANLNSSKSNRTAEAAGDSPGRTAEDGSTENSLSKAAPEKPPASQEAGVESGSTDDVLAINTSHSNIKNLSETQPLSDGGVMAEDRWDTGVAAAAAEPADTEQVPHEPAHTVQQGAGAPGRWTQKGTDDAIDGGADRAEGVSAERQKLWTPANFRESAAGGEPGGGGGGGGSAGPEGVSADTRAVLDVDDDDDGPSTLLDLSAITKAEGASAVADLDLDGAADLAAMPELDTDADFEASDNDAGTPEI